MPTRFLGVFLLSFLCVADDLPKLPPATMGLIDEARALPPEFGSDILLRLAGSRLIVEPRWKRALVEEAFTSGAHAQLPYRKVGEATTDARASRAYWRNNLEALSLQTRAVEAMLALDSQRARVMFEEIATPQVPALACTDMGAPDLTAYYETAAKVFAGAFTAEQRLKLLHIQFLERVIGLMQSPAHVVPAVKLVFTVQATPEQRQELVSALAGVLERVNGTPRVFFARTFQLVPVSAPVKLPEGVRAAAPILESAPGELPSAVAAAAPVLIPALRSYIVRHVSGPRCSEYMNPGKLPGVVNDFNFLIGKLDPTASLYKAITEDEAKPAKDDGTFESHTWWQSNRSKQVLDALKWLNHGNRLPPGGGSAIQWTLEERMSNEWTSHFLDTLKLIEGWKEEEEDSPEDWFGMVSEAYQTCAEKAPPGKQRDAAMTRYLNFMETRYAVIESRNLWFTQWHNLWSSKDPWIQEQLLRSANPVIALYAKVNKLLSAAV